MPLSNRTKTAPISEFHWRSADFIKRLKKEKHPITLTRYGKGAAVLMDFSEFVRLTIKMEMLEDLLEAKQQVVQGKISSISEARERIEKHLSKFNQFSTGQ